MPSPTSPNTAAAARIVQTGSTEEPIAASAK
jgi:hypothetical protein